MLIDDKRNNHTEPPRITPNHPRTTSNTSSEFPPKTQTKKTQQHKTPLNHLHKMCHTMQTQHILQTLQGTTSEVRCVANLGACFGSAGKRRSGASSSGGVDVTRLLPPPSPLPPPIPHPPVVAPTPSPHIHILLLLPLLLPHILFRLVLVLL